MPAPIEFALLSIFDSTTALHMEHCALAHTGRTKTKRVNNIFVNLCTTQKYEGKPGFAMRKEKSIIKPFKS